MPRLRHGEVLPLTTAKTLINALGLAQEDSLKAFDFMFKDLVGDPASRLPESPETGRRLMALGESMVETDPDNDKGDSSIPAAYTYLGQFIDHDITLETLSGNLVQLGPEIVPLQNPTENIKNLRTATLDLDSVYDKPAPREDAVPEEMKVGLVSPTPSQNLPFRRPPGKDDFNDLPRQKRDPDNMAEDRAARIGDARNDENTIVAQLHTAFLRAHNELVRTHKLDHAGAQSALRQRYQSVVLDDFLPKICDPKIVEDILTNGPKIWKPAGPAEIFMPLEFAVAAYRFGHSMVRNAYNFNLNFNRSKAPGTRPATVEFLFTFTALSGQLGGAPDEGGFETLPENWIIEWPNVLPVDQTPHDKARLINTLLATPLFLLRDLKGVVEGGVDGGGKPQQPIAARLAIRNLLRGYRLGLPTGQAVAARIGAPVLAGDALLAALPNDAQRNAVRAGGFAERTPLWFYILAEAGAGGGGHLGEVGSRIVAETLYNLVRFSADSIIPADGKRTWQKFTLQDILALAKVI